MNLDAVKNFFSNLNMHDLPAGGAGLIGIVLLVLVFRSGKTANRFLLFVIALGLFAGAWWWHEHR
jgi:hypothetical protein